MSLNFNKFITTIWEKEFKPCYDIFFPTYFEELWARISELCHNIVDLGSLNIQLVTELCYNIVDLRQNNKFNEGCWIGGCFWAADKSFQTC